MKNGNIKSTEDILNDCLTLCNSLIDWNEIPLSINIESLRDDLDIKVREFKYSRINKSKELK